MQATTVDRHIKATRAFDVARGGDGLAIHVDPAICRGAVIFGIDVDDDVEALEREFGSVVQAIPWLDYTDQTAGFRGCGVALFPFWLFYRLVRKLIEGGNVMPTSDPRSFPHRLALGEIAAVIVRGAWSPRVETPA